MPARTMLHYPGVIYEVPLVGSTERFWQRTFITGALEDISNCRLIRRRAATKNAQSSFPQGCSTNAERFLLKKGRLHL